MQLTLYIAGQEKASWTIDTLNWPTINALLARAKEESAGIIAGNPYEFIIEGVKPVLVNLTKDKRLYQFNREPDFGNATKLRKRYKANRLSRVGG